ncbi:HTH-type transcriptional regulator LutR [Arthrobacter ulcerisalmonis]|uniref:HTH-type transcriptional regulator LutR n=1 Tax=Arthrobacter ulcerisalmonis TaxID=2483813 RepID=A0A3P5W590_9MICC|nr:FadR/GntR family transcriptional regulator [Arthrobacter ulcerisalmonis]VDC18459.1 HTH-type transcriptional regulator LutR [Arthrobacter ulcerisalmonis]
MANSTAKTRRLAPSSYNHLRITSQEVEPEPPSRSGTSIDLTQKLLAFLAHSDILPGQRLPGERQLAEQLGVGRNVLREALKLLNILGFLEIRQGDGTFLTNKTSNLLPKIVEWGLFLGDHSIEALIEARSVLETTLVEMAAGTATPEDLIRIEQHYAFMQDAAARGDSARYAAADIAFHLSIAKASGNPVLEGVILNIRSLMQSWTDKVLSSDVNLCDSLALHLPILEAIKAQDQPAARQAMKDHMTVAVANLRRALGTLPPSQ